MILLKSFQVLHKNTCVGVSFNNVAVVLRACSVIKKDSNTDVELAKFLGATILKNICQRMLLNFV